MLYLVKKFSSYSPKISKKKLVTHLDKIRSALTVYHQFKNIQTYIKLFFCRQHIDRLSQRLRDKINAALPNVIFNGDPENTYAGCVNLSFAFVEGIYFNFTKKKKQFSP